VEIRSKALGAIIAIVIFGGIMGASALGLWKTETVRNPAKLQISESIGNVAGENVGTGTGTYDPADIRGNHRFGEISEMFAIPLETLSRAFALPATVDPATLAVDILKSSADLSAEQIAYLDAYTIEIEFEWEPISMPEDEVQSSDEADGDAEDTVRKQDEMVVAGKTTFADLLAWGVSAEQIESIIGGEIPNHLVLVYDYCAENELTFGGIKADLQYEVDRLRP
jgi:hypothetical protein